MSIHSRHGCNRESTSAWATTSNRSRLWLRASVGKKPVNLRLMLPRSVVHPDKVSQCFSVSRMVPRSGDPVAQPNRDRQILRFLAVRRFRVRTLRNGPSIAGAQ